MMAALEGQEARTGKRASRLEGGPWRSRVSGSQRWSLASAEARAVSF
jgi:hypothetical protein